MEQNQIEYELNIRQNPNAFFLHNILNEFGKTIQSLKTFWGTDNLKLVCEIFKTECFLKK